MQAVSATQMVPGEHSVAAMIVAQATIDGSAGNAHRAGLVGAHGGRAARDIADAVHLLCHLHGRHPGVVDIAFEHSAPGIARNWLAALAEQFAEERLYLVRLVSAVGPLPSTPGAAETESALLAQRHAIETLARSERSGCALGAAAALLLDWTAMRALLDHAAHRAGIDGPRFLVADQGALAEALDAVADSSPAARRAIGFGAEQMLLQHAALFALLEARSAARLAADGF